MDKKRASETGIRVELMSGTDEAVALDQLVDDLLHGNSRGMLKNLHEPYSEEVVADPGAGPGGRA